MLSWQWLESLTSMVCAHLDGQITQTLGELQRVESKLAQLRETFDHQKLDIRSLQRKQQANNRALEPKVL